MKAWYKNRAFWIGVGIMVLGLTLRFYRLKYRFLFTLDEEYQTALAQTIVRDFHIIWVGVSASVDFYLGPLWTYFTALWLFLSKGDPVITGYVSSVIGAITVGAVYGVTRKLYGNKAGVIAALLYATLPLIVFFEQRYWNPSLASLLSLVMYYSLTQVKKSPWWWVIFAGGLGLILHTHLSLFPYVLIAMVLGLRYWRSIPVKVFLASVATVAVLISPLLVFDYFHNFSNIGVVLRIGKTPRDETTQVNPRHKLESLSQFLGRFWYLKPHGINADEVQWSASPVAVYGNPSCPESTWTVPSKWLSLLGWVVVAAFLLRLETWRHQSSQILASTLLLMLASFIFYPGLAVEYYLLGIFPLLVMLPGITWSDSTVFPKKLFYLIFGLMLPVLGIWTILTVREDFGMFNRRQLIERTMAVINNGSYTLLEDGQCHKWEGWRYLFATYGRKPLRSSVDNQLGWLYPDDLSTASADFSVIVFEDRSPLDSARWTGYLQKITVGGYSASVYANRN